jgi:hypothetical protein
LAEKFGIVFKDLTTLPEYAGFVTSPQYRSWLEAREKK